MDRVDTARQRATAHSHVNAPASSPSLTDGASLPYYRPMHSVLETSIFTRRADALLTREERAELINALADNPRSGDLIPGLSGIRKMRVAAGGQGKRGGFRVIWYVLTDDMPVLALLLYGKGEQANPSPGQRKAMLAVVEGMKEQAAGRRAKEG